MTKKELGYIELEWTCKHCNTINPGMQRVCSNCGAPIELDDKFELPDQQELIKDKEKLEQATKGPSIQCPYCNVLNPAGTKNCIQCGGDIEAGLARQAGEVLGAHDTTLVPDKPCPFCSQPVKANAQRCPHCGGSLVEAAPAAAAAAAKPKKNPLWLIIGGIALGVICIASVITMIVLSNRTSDVTGSVRSLSWQLSTDIVEKQPVNREAWSESVPQEAQNVSCRDQYKETSSFPAPKSTEVCGTPYVVDQGSGAGKVVQDCEYLVYESYCTFTVMDWVVVNTLTNQGSDANPIWPSFNLAAGQQEGDRHATFEVIFDVDGQSYTYTPRDMEEFSQFTVDSQWILGINTFGNIKELRLK